MVPWIPPYIFHPRCQWFWSKIHLNKKDVDHLVASIQETYTLTKDWMGNLYCGIMLIWGYVNRMVDISMPGYVKKNSRNTSTLNQKEPKSVHTHQHQNSLDLRHRYHFLKTHPLNLMKREYVVCNLLPGVLYTMRGQLIWPFKWP